MIVVKCKQCNKLFNSYKSWDRSYCSEECFIINMAGNNNAAGGKAITVTCLGPFCRGRKTFKSKKHIHKFGICDDCKKHNRGMSDII